MAKPLTGDLKPISSTTITKLTGHPETQHKNSTWHSMGVQVRIFLPLNDYITTIHHIVQDCTGENGEIMQELIDFAIRINIIAAYAYVEMPDNIDDLYIISYASGLYELVCSVANTSQIKAICDCVYRILEIGGNQHGQYCYRNEEQIGPVCSRA